MQLQSKARFPQIASLVAMSDCFHHQPKRMFSGALKVGDRGYGVETSIRQELQRWSVLLKLAQ
jgi:hypothetical protein